MDTMRCTRDKVSEILVRMIRRDADFTFRSHGPRSYSLYCENRSVDTLRTMIPKMSSTIHHHEDGAVSALIFFDITEVTR